MLPAVPPQIWTLSTYFSLFVNTVGAVVLLSRIALKVLPKPQYQFGWYGTFITTLQHAALCLGEMESQI